MCLRFLSSNDDEGSKSWLQKKSTFISPALLPNFCVNSASESMVPLGSGAGLLISANASLMRAQSNRNMLWPAHILPGVQNNEYYNNSSTWAEAPIQPETNRVKKNSSF